MVGRKLAHLTNPREELSTWTGHLRREMLSYICRYSYLWSNWRHSGRQSLWGSKLHITSQASQRWVGVNFRFSKTLYREHSRRYKACGGVSNGPVYPASGLGSDRRNRLVQFQTRPTTRPDASWRVKPRPVPINPWVLPGWARPIGTTLRFCVSGFTIYCHIQICYSQLQNIDVGTSLWVFGELAGVMIETNRVAHPTTSWIWASTKGQRLLVVYFGLSGGRQVVQSHKRSIGCLYIQQRQWNAPYHILKMSVNRTSMIFGCAASVMEVGVDYKHSSTRIWQYL